MAKTDVSDPEVSNPDPSVLNPSEDDTTNLNRSRPNIFKPDLPDPDLLKPAPFIAAPRLGRDVEEPAIALLTEISASLRELKDFSARFMKLVELPEAETLGRRTDRNNIRLRGRSISRRTIELVFNNGPRAVCGSQPKRAPEVMRPGPKKPALAGPWPIIKNHPDSIGSRTTDSASQGESSDAIVDIMEAEQGRRDRRGTTGSDNSDIIEVISHHTESSEDGTVAST